MFNPVIRASMSKSPRCFQFLSWRIERIERFFVISYEIGFSKFFEFVFNFFQIGSECLSNLFSRKKVWLFGKEF